MPPSNDARFASALRISVMRLSRRMRQERPVDGLTASQLATLASLERHGPLAAGELANVERVSAPSMTRIIGALAVAGLVDRRPHPSDGRQILVAISDNGRSLLARDRRRRDEWLTTRLDELTPEQLEVLEQALPLLDRLASE